MYSGQACSLEHTSQLLRTGRACPQFLGLGKDAGGWGRTEGAEGDSTRMQPPNPLIGSAAYNLFRRAGLTGTAEFPADKNYLIHLSLTRLLSGRQNPYLTFA